VTTECKHMQRKMTSSMELTSTFGFIRLPNRASVQPFERFELIMPGEIVEITVIFQSQMLKKHKHTIQVPKPQGQKFSIPCVVTVLTLLATLWDDGGVPDNTVRLGDRHVSNQSLRQYRRAPTSPLSLRSGQSCCSSDQRSRQRTNCS
jgi:hypothetical protein